MYKETKYTLMYICKRVDKETMDEIIDCPLAVNIY